MNSEKLGHKGCSHFWKPPQTRSSVVWIQNPRCIQQNRAAANGYDAGMNCTVRGCRPPTMADHNGVQLVCSESKLCGKAAPSNFVVQCGPEGPKGVKVESWRNPASFGLKYKNYVWRSMKYRSLLWKGERVTFITRKGRSDILPINMSPTHMWSRSRSLAGAPDIVVSILFGKSSYQCVYIAGPF